MTVRSIQFPIKALIMSALSLWSQMAFSATKPVLDCMVMKSAPELRYPAKSPNLGDRLVIDLNKNTIKSLDFITLENTKSTSLNLGSTIPLRLMQAGASQANYLAIGYSTTIELLIESADGILNVAQVSVSNFDSSAENDKIVSTIELDCRH